MATSRPRRARDLALNDARALAAQCIQRLVELRAHTTETQKQLAKCLKMTGPMISRLESGDRVSSVKTLCRIANAFERRLEIVFDEYEHEHGGSTRHLHPHSLLYPDHHHRHGAKE